MEEKPLDLRIQKTHRALTQAYAQLLEEKRFEHITVNEICDRAMVRRATFYKHFGDKYELFSFLVRQIHEEFRRRPARTGKTIVPYVSIIESTLDFLDEYDSQLHFLMESSMAPVLLSLISEQIALDITQELQEAEKSGQPLPLPAELMAHAYTGALIHTAKWWLGHKDRISKQEMAAQLVKMIQRLYSDC